MHVRPMSVAGAFYPANPVKLRQLISKFFEEAEIELTAHIKSAVAPHAGYVYSGIVAAYTYKVILQNFDAIPSTIVILSPSHYVPFEGVSVGLFEKLQTPLGAISGDTDLANFLLDRYPRFFTHYYEPQIPEHAVETQLPFLRYIFDLAGEEKKVLPLVFGQTDVIGVGEILSNLDDVFFIVSSDLSHYLTYSEAIKRDQESLRAFLKQDLKMIVEIADACGKRPWAALTVVSLFKKRKTKLLKYLNSGDTAGDKLKVVGYSSVIYL